MLSAVKKEVTNMSINLNKTYFADIYNSACSATDELSKIRHLLGHYHYLTGDEHKLLRQALHLLYEKIVTVGNDIQRYKEAETTASKMPEPVEEFITSLHP